MSERHWVPITTVDQIPPREGRLALVGGREIAIFNLVTGFFAVDNRCPHRGGPLADGIVSGHSVVCPLHAWKIDLEHGTVERPADAGACVRRYDVRVVDNRILLRLEDAARDGEAA
jgi:nitrite reductase (NADH) small subunit